jgi:alpha/beta superfamily hydrolase
LNSNRLVEIIAGPVGSLETIAVPAVGDVRGIALICHPNPTQGGTNTNKVVQILAKTLSRRGYIAYCPNLRGVGQSAGTHDRGIGEVDDAAAVVNHARRQYGELPLVLAGFSFGTFVVAQLRQRIEADKLILAGPACGRFTLPAVPAGTLVVHGEQAEVIPFADVLDWARPQHLPVVVIPGCSHFFHGYLTQLSAIVDQCWKVTIKE